MAVLNRQPDTTERIALSADLCTETLLRLRGTGVSESDLLMAFYDISSRTLLFAEAAQPTVPTSRLDRIQTSRGTARSVKAFSSRRNAESPLLVW